MKTIRLKLEDRQAELLDRLSKTAGIPKSALVRKGIDMVLRQMREDIISVELQREIDALLREDTEFLRCLGKV
jgi:predicted DNA-binding protein